MYTTCTKLIRGFFKLFQQHAVNGYYQQQKPRLQQPKTTAADSNNNTINHSSWWLQWPVAAITPLTTADHSSQQLQQPTARTTPLTTTANTAAANNYSSLQLQKPATATTTPSIAAADDCSSHSSWCLQQPMTAAAHNCSRHHWKQLARKAMDMHETMGQSHGDHGGSLDVGNFSLGSNDDSVNGCWL